MAGPGGIGADPTRGFDKVPNAARDMDLKKQIRKSASVTPGEQIIEGANSEALADFVRARREEPVHKLARPGLIGRIRSRFTRGS